MSITDKFAGKINNKIINKLDNRGKILAQVVKLVKPSKIFKLDYKIKKIPNASQAKYLEKKIKLINYNVFNRDIKFNIKQQLCDQCKLMDGLFIFKPFYKDNYLDNFYNIIDETYNNNKNDPTFTYQNDKKRVFMFDNLNIYEVIKHSHKLNKSLVKYIFRYIVDILYLLKVPKTDIGEFNLKSKLVIVRYEQNSGIHSHIDNIKRGNGAVVLSCYLQRSCK